MTRSAKAVMVLGCTSDAGKSWLATALCRWYARQGLVVRPYKAQNMSNHARVVPLHDGAPGELGEIGSAQYFQALAAGCAPDVRMNPILLKPEADTRSQVLVRGRVDPALTTLPWRERSARLWPLARAALHALRDEAELLVIEGAGSPAEINLAANDYVNTFTAIEAQARCLLVADIDRGGAFAHLHGTTALMDAQVRTQLAGYVLNKFRGDARLLSPAPEMLEAATGVPTLAVIPMRRGHGLPEEDAVPADARGAHGLPAQRRVVILATPHASNLDEFEPLARCGLALRWVRSTADLREALADSHWLVLPGSKHTRADLAWVRAQTGMAEAIRAHVAAQRPLLAVCGALQWLGAVVDDPQGLEGGTAGSAAGLGLLPLHTRYAPHKGLSRAAHRLGRLDGPWAPLSDLAVDGYEIHLGQTRPLTSGDAPAEPLRPAFAGRDDLGWQQGPVLAVYLHGLFENPAVLQALFGRAVPPLDRVFDDLADLLDASFRPGALMGLLR
ncbi:MAG: hypothetical protein RIQ53_2730 [Pseudomonadota bacterium]